MKQKLINAAEGALGGLFGSMLIQQELKMAMRLPDRFKPAGPKRDPGVFLMERIERLSPRPVPRKLMRRGAKALAFVYGGFFGTLMGLLAPRAGLGRRSWKHAALAGAGLGTAVWAVGFLGWIPALGLGPPIHRHKPGAIATSLAAHLGYGMAAVLPLQAIEQVRERRARRRRRGIWARLLRR